jgi:hypothetical protein
MKKSRKAQIPSNNFHGHSMNTILFLFLSKINRWIIWPSLKGTISGKGHKKEFKGNGKITGNVLQTKQHISPFIWLWFPHFDQFLINPNHCGSN